MKIENQFLYTPELDLKDPLDYLVCSSIAYNRKKGIKFDPEETVSAIIARSALYSFPRDSRGTPKFNQLMSRLTDSMKRLASLGVIKRDRELLVTTSFEVDSFDVSPNRGIWFSSPLVGKKFFIHDGVLDSSAWGINLAMRGYDSKYIFSTMKGHIKDRISKPINWKDAIRIISAGVKGSRHITVGSYRRDPVSVDFESIFIPYIVIDIDRDDMYEALNASRLFIDDILSSEISELSIQCFYTGGGGFHILIDSSVAGLPMFQRPEFCKDALSRLVLSYGNADTNLFSPGHSYRMAGSQHEESQLFKIPLTINELNTLKPEQIIALSRRPRRVSVQEFGTFEPSPEFIKLILELGDVKFIPQFSNVNAVGGTVKRIEQGIEEGENWSSKHSGRNKAMYIYSLYALRSTSDLKEAWNMLVEMNKRNSPPLQDHELSGRFSSAIRKLGLIR